jgi:hypothetical protein
VRTSLTLAVSILVAATLAGGASALKLPPPPSLPAGWSHASINVVVRHVPHTFTYDHGRVAAVSPTSLTLREPDGSIVTIGIDASTIVRIAGRQATIDQVRRLETATTVTVDGGPAALVKIQAPLRSGL